MLRNCDAVHDPCCQRSGDNFVSLRMSAPSVSSGFMALTMLLMGGQLAAIARADATLLAYYPFEDGSGHVTQDAAGRNGGGGLGGDAAFTTGKYGIGLEVTGFGDWVDTGRSIVDTSHSFSVACWVNLVEGFDADFRSAISQDAKRA